MNVVDADQGGGGICRGEENSMAIMSASTSTTRRDEGEGDGHEEDGHPRE